MANIREMALHVSRLVRGRVPGLPAPTNEESPLPYVPNPPSVNPILPVHDMDAVIAFYRSVGFAVTAYDAGYAWVRTCGWEFFHLALADGLVPGASRAAAFVHVSDVDAWHRAMRSNAPDVPIRDVIEQPWGMREYSITDPAGNVVRIGQNV